jgi:NAD(P)H-hydrate repair Nnr-like enzyme with NAD(P)H-hydrate dehydratase domain
MHEYWQKQLPTSPLFPDIEWTKPEQRSRAGKLLIVGGNKLGFVAVASSYQEALDTGAGQVRVLLPDALQRAIPATILDTVFAASTPAGGLGKDDQGAIDASLAWSEHTLLIGDAGRNAETAIAYERMLTSSRPLTITRDAVDILKNVSQALVERPQTTLIVSFAQLQKVFQSVYYPKMLGFSMQVNLLVEILHKFTISYPTTIVTYHQNQLVIAHGGDVVTQEFDDPMMIWRGTVATRIACYQLWTPGKPLETSATAVFGLAR